MAEKLTHWKKLQNPNYLGAYELNQGEELVLTIKYVAMEDVVNPQNDGKKEACSVMHFVENVKPMILNITNSKTLEKLFKTPYVEEWSGRKIQIYVEKVKAFGEVWDALRIRNFLPIEKELKCADCGCKIESFGKMSAETLAKYTLGKYGKTLCSNCATKISETQTNATTDEGVL